MAVTVTTYDLNEHSLTLNMGNSTEMVVHHLSDQQMDNLRAAFSSANDAPDPTPNQDLSPAS